jgi:hypothetical protein
MLRTPVAIIVFRRPEVTRRLLAVLAEVKPSDLYVIADGPRPGNEGDVVACKETRALFDSLPWNCKIHRCFSEENLGCGIRPASGLDWLFDRVEQAIILEDDCLPDMSFFAFCEELLLKYADDERVMHISGSTYRDRTANVDSSYFFSRYPACWGWATWRRAWRLYDFNVSAWSELKDTEWLARLINESVVEEFWAAQFSRAAEDREAPSFWDYQWAFNCWANSGVSIFPRCNLVSNLGCGEDATHLHGKDDPLGNVPVGSIEFPLRHPARVLPDPKEDWIYVNEFLLPRLRKPEVGLVRRARRAVSRCLRR